MAFNGVKIRQRRFESNSVFTNAVQCTTNNDNVSSSFLVLQLSLKGSQLQILISVAHLGFMSLYVQLK